MSATTVKYTVKEKRLLQKKQDEMRSLHNRVVPKDDMKAEQHQCNQEDAIGSKTLKACMMHVASKMADQYLITLANRNTLRGQFVLARNGILNYNEQT